MDSWRSRIVGHGEERVADLMPHPLNARLHGDIQREALAALVSEVGFLRSIMVNRRTGRLLDGHLRVDLARQAGVEMIPVEYVDLAEAEEATVLASFDPIGALAEIDGEALDALLREVETGEPALQHLMADLAKDAGLYREAYHHIDYEDEGEGEATARRRDDEGGQEADDAEEMETAAVMVAVVLAPDEFLRWEAVKERLGVRVDRVAFMRLVELAEATEGEGL